MLRLFRLLLSLVVIGLLVYVAVAVPLGRKTLWQHLRAIAGSKESRDLVDEVKHKAGEVLHHDAGPPPRKGSGDELTPKERQALRKLIKEKLGDAPK
jgi:hypothetical protein